MDIDFKETYTQCVGLPLGVQFYRVVISGVYKCDDNEVEIWFCHLSILDWRDSEDQDKGCMWVKRYDWTKTDDVLAMCQLLKAADCDLGESVRLEFVDRKLIEPCLDGKSVGVILGAKEGRSEIYGYFPVYNISAVPLLEQDWAD